MPITNYTQGPLLAKIRDAILGITNDWPADPRNVAAGYRHLLSSKTPGRDYLSAGREIAGNMARDTQGYLDRVNQGDPEAMMPFFMMNNPQEIAARVREQLLMNKRAGRDLFQGIDKADLDLVEEMSKVGKRVPPNEDFATWAKGIGGGRPQMPPQATTEAPEGISGVLQKDYGALNDKERNFVNNALSPEYLSMLLPLILGGGAMAAGAEE